MKLKYLVSRNTWFSPWPLIPQTGIEESQMQSISMPIFCVFEKYKPNLKIKKIELFIFIKSTLDAWNLQNSIGFCIKLH